MIKSLARKTGAAFLLLAIWMSATATSFAQEQAKQPAGAKKESKDKKDKKKAEVAKPADNPKRPLSVNEDPAMIGKRNINKGGDSFFGWLGGSREKEVAIGRQIAAEIEQQVKLNEDPVVTEYVNRVGQNIVLHSDSKIPFTIKVINSDEMNAFALPGGYFYVNTGLILAADNEAELAGVMAHEIAHVAARHAMENQGKGQLLGIGMLGAIIFTGGIAGSILQNTSGIAQAIIGSKFTRSAEEEADKLGVQYLYASGYDPTAMATMFEKLASQSKKKPNALLKLFATHPQAVNRRDASIALASRFAEKEEYVISTSEFQKVKSRLLKLTNAKAATATDLDEGEEGKPTLKRRQPVPEEGAGEQGESSSSEGEKPQLKRKDADPKPTPPPNF